jgi:hypothetical protein
VTGIAALSAYFDGSVRDDDHDIATYLVTTTADGWPHAAMVGVGELRVAPDGQARVALWERSTTVANLRRDGRALLLVVVDGRAVRARLAVTAAGFVDGGEAGRLALFAGTVAAASVDDAPYAEVTSGLRFRLRDPEPTLARWRATQELIARTLT